MYSLTLPLFIMLSMKSMENQQSFWFLLFFFVLFHFYPKVWRGTVHRQLCWRRKSARTRCCSVRQSTRGTTFHERTFASIVRMTKKWGACQGRVALESGRVGMFCANQQTRFNIFTKNSQGATKSFLSTDLYISSILSTKVQNLRCQP